MKGTKSERLSSGEVRELIGLEEELSALKEKYGISEKKTLFAKIGERYYRFRDAHVHPKLVKRTPYLWLCLLAIFGVNQFYAPLAFSTGWRRFRRSRMRWEELKSEKQET